MNCFYFIFSNDDIDDVVGHSFDYRCVDEKAIETAIGAAMRRRFEGDMMRIGAAMQMAIEAIDAAMRL